MSSKCDTRSGCKRFPHLELPGISALLESTAVALGDFVIVILQDMMNGGGQGLLPADNTFYQHHIGSQIGPYVGVILLFD